MKKTAKALVLATITLSVIASTGFNVNADTNSTNLTVASYKDYLKNYDTQDAEKAGVQSQYISSAVSGAATELNNFNKMSPDSQKKFVNSMSNPKQQNYTESDSNDTLSTVATMSLLRSSASSSTSRSTQYTYSRKPGKYWPAITTVRIKVNYKTKGKKVLKTTSSDAYVVKNYNPMVSLNKDGQKRYVTNNQAYAWGRWSYTIGIGKYGITTGHINASVKGNYKGTRTFYHGWAN